MEGQMHLKNIAIVGVNGRVGRAIAAELVNHATFRTTGILQPTSTEPAPFSVSSGDQDDIVSKTLSTTRADFSSEASLTSALHGQDAVVCAVPAGATQLATQKILIDACVAAGVRFFFASEFIGDVASPRFAEFPTQIVGEKIRVREYLDSLAAEGKMAWTALNGGPILDLWMKIPVGAGFDFSKQEATLYNGGTNRACWTPLRTLALAAVSMLEKPELVRNRSVLICGIYPLVTQVELLEAVRAELDDGQGTGKGNLWTVKYVDLGPIKEQAFANLRAGNLKGAMLGMTLNANFNEADSHSNFWDQAENALLGVQPETVRSAVAKFLLEEGHTKNQKH